MSTSSPVLSDSDSVSAVALGATPTGNVAADDHPSRRWGEGLALVCENCGTAYHLSDDRSASAPLWCETCGLELHHKPSAASSLAWGMALVVITIALGVVLFLIQG
ncbi:MAG: hypothetical protein JNJ88_06520 [Planctomycetes bacterium]|nr:hypothetical protein [Planctomycetota bacterium]